MTLNESEWEAELSVSLGYPIKVEYTRARSSPIQLRHPKPLELRQHPKLKGGWVVRLHRMFEDAPPEIRADLASWIRAGRRAKRACRDLGSWTEFALKDLPPKATRRISLQPKGLVHNLELIVAGLSDTEFPEVFGEQVQHPEITWGKRAKSRSRGTIQLGSFNSAQNVIRLHPVMDQHAVPRWFIRYVLFHELLHAAIPSERSANGGKYIHHGLRFTTREKDYVDYGRALAWEAKHLPKLLRSARANKPLHTKQELA
jgi:hypothetical protein